MAKHSVVRSAAALLNEVNPVSGVSKIKRSPTAYEKKVYQVGSLQRMLQQPVDYVHKTDAPAQSSTVSSFHL